MTTAEAIIRLAEAIETATIGLGLAIIAHAFLTQRNS